MVGAKRLYPIGLHLHAVVWLRIRRTALRIEPAGSADPLQKKNLRGRDREMDLRMADGAREFSRIFIYDNQTAEDLNKRLRDIGYI